MKVGYNVYNCRNYPAEIKTFFLAARQLSHAFLFSSITTEPVQKYIFITFIGNFCTSACSCNYSLVLVEGNVTDRLLI
jgi:hypothetical protein